MRMVTAAVHANGKAWTQPLWLTFKKSLQSYTVETSGSPSGALPARGMMSSAVKEPWFFQAHPTISYA